jgi:hypothetical protein
VKINQKSEWKRFLIRKGGKNADLIGKESLWIYTVYSPSVVKINQKSEWKRFLIRKGDKNTDLIGKEHRHLFHSKKYMPPPLHYIYLLIAIFSDWKHRWRNTIYIQEIEIRSYVISLGDNDFIFSAQKIFVTHLRNIKKENFKSVMFLE